LKDCRSREALREAILEVLGSAGEPLTSAELLERLREVCGGEVDVFTARMVLAELVRRGVVERARGDELRGIPRHVYRLVGAHRQPK